MAKGYSKLLINENVISDIEATLMETGRDTLMMSLFAARERTAQSWKTLLESAGLKIMKIWTTEQGWESLIEAELRGRNLEGLQ